MGVKVYYYVVAAVLGFGFLIPQHGNKKKIYIALMAILHTFICGWRYMYLTGDLRKYAWGYYNIIEPGWFSAEVFNGGRNFGVLAPKTVFDSIRRRFSGISYLYRNCDGGRGCSHCISLFACTLAQLSALELFWLLCVRIQCN